MRLAAAVLYLSHYGRKPTGNCACLPVCRLCVYLLPAYRNLQQPPISSNTCLAEFHTAHVCMYAFHHAGGVVLQLMGPKSSNRKEHGTRAQWKNAQREVEENMLFMEVSAAVLCLA